LAENALGENIKSNLIAFKKLLGYNLSDPCIIKPEYAKLSLIHLIKIEIQNKKMTWNKKRLKKAENK
jgi:hypothetical protein